MYTLCLIQKEWNCSTIMVYPKCLLSFFCTCASCPGPLPTSNHDKKHTAGYTVTGGNKKQVHSLHFPLSSVGSATKASSLVVRVCKGCFCRGSSVRRLLEMGHRWLTAWLTRTGQSQTGSIPPPRRSCVTTHFTCLSCLCSTTRLLEETIQLTTF